MIFRLPTEDDEIILSEYVREHHDKGENSISASMGLPVMQYSEWLSQVHSCTVKPNEFGLSLLYLCFNDDRLVGLLSIRYDMNDKMAMKYGHIGYGVRPSERNKGYATMMLSYALSICRKKGLTEVILGCYKSNSASASVIKKCGGILIDENDNYKKGIISQYFRIIL